jgi:polar amino acid transport system substrate-binding protein
VNRFIYLCSCLVLSFSINSQTWQLVTEPFPPYFIGEQSKPGWLHEVIVAALKTQGQKASIEYTHWARALKLAKRNKRVAVLGAFHNHARAADYYYSHPLAVANTVLFKRADTDILYTGSLYSLAPYTISKGEDYVVSDSFESHPQLTIVTADSLADSLLLLLNGRVDLVAGSKEVGQYWLANNERLRAFKEKQVSVLKPYLASQYLHVISAKSHPQALHFQNSLRIGVEELLASGGLEKILRHYEFSDIEINKIKRLLSKI